MVNMGSCAFHVSLCITYLYIDCCSLLSARLGKRRFEGDPPGTGMILPSLPVPSADRANNTRDFFLTHLGLVLRSLYHLLLEVWSCLTWPAPAPRTLPLSHPPTMGVSLRRL